MTTYDCFTYYGSDTERRLLALRLAETAEVVDRWVLVESPMTFSGQAKPLHYSVNHRLDPEIAPYADRIHVVVAAPVPYGSTWAREAAQRAAIVQGLWAQGVQLDDWVLVSDLDEIPSADAIRRVMNAPHPGVYMLAQRLSYYYLNCVADQQPWYGTRMARFRDIPNTQVVRLLGGHTVSNGGWHFSYLGGVDAIREKINAYSHQELNRPEYTNDDHLEGCLRIGRDLFGREDMRFKIMVMDSKLPQLVMADPRPFADWIAPGTVSPKWEPKDAEPASSDANLRQEVLG